MMAQTSSHGTTVSELLDRKREAFAQFLTATRRLSRTDIDDLTHVNTQLQRRNACMDIIDHIDKRIGRITADDPSYASTLSLDERDRIRTIMQEIDTSAREASTLSTEFENRLSASRTKIQTQMKRLVRSHHRDFQGYGIRKAGEKAGPRFLDIRL